jgi:hypothetical protein
MGNHEIYEAQRRVNGSLVMPEASTRENLFLQVQLALYFREFCGGEPSELVEFMARKQNAL